MLPARKRTGARRRRQFAGQPGRDLEEVAYLHHLAGQARLVESETRWHELWSDPAGRSARRL